ncbi:unnamed protein product [Darwinula stevensoni]|uniref:Uncharacterized protein n=1 Tax=Darwinula stevensoni TaxID=69355 RepID=A0A7R9A723_9CRUS|nr:unnamed protein product [Darwinula stevensoni]CAG0889886.1 unnamed protein product [Darwinula stevensoni]
MGMESLLPATTAVQSPAGSKKTSLKCEGMEPLLSTTTAAHSPVGSRKTRDGRSSGAEYREVGKAHSITQMLPSCSKLKKCPSGFFKYSMVHNYLLKSVLENRWMDLALLGDSSIIE